MDRPIKKLMLRARSGSAKVRRSQIAFFLISLCLVPSFAAEAPVPAAAGSTPITTITSERNVKNDSGELTVIMKRLPGDPRSGETGHVLVSLSETVQGGFGSGPLPVEKAAVMFSITRPDGAVVAGNMLATEEPGGLYRGIYVFDSAGDYKIAFSITTEDKRTFSADFPVTVSRAPIRTSFWIALLIVLVLSGVALAVVLYALKRKGDTSFRRLAPAGAVVLAVFLLSAVALAYLLPPFQTRETAAIPPDAFSTAAVNELPKGTTITLPKESQLLFGIKTQLIDTRQITSGLKTTGVVRARPDAKGVVTAQVPGRIVLNQAVSLGSAVGRGEQIGYVEQVLDVAGQAGLETQRLDVEAQQREVEARKLELRNTVLSLQSQQAQSRAAASQARTRLAQAQRELRRSQNLLEVGAVPRKRVEEAQTAVKVGEDEVASADKQVVLLGEQIKSAQAGQSIFRSPTIRQPSRNFPLISPITGLVSQINATSGQQVASGAELLNIVNLSTVLLEAQVFEKDLATVRESTRASFTSSALLGEVYTIGTPDGDGRLISVGQTVNDQTRTVPVIYEVKNPFNRLKDGNFIEITIDTSGDKQVLAVPKSAIVREQGETFVFVFDGGETFERRQIALGAEGADFYEIVSGLKEGDRVVIEGVYQLRTTQAGE
ncbi:MAG: efflux RND transporter periplasmic adaptor subunit [Pyrinomonadaceae bacterium]|jgi:multidrug efflux pump subunit AcrA (membrane-fusion protein)